MRTAVIALSGAALLLGPAPAAAQAAADKADVRCFLVLKLAERDPKAREQAAKGAYYYMGRLAARGPVARLEPIMVGEGRAITSAAQAQAELTRCAGELNQNQAQFNAVSQKMAASQRPAAAPAKK
jgi:hypothetical protein